MASSEDEEFLRNLTELETLGFTVVRDVFRPDEIAKMQKDYERVREEAERMINHTEPKPRVWFESGVETRSRYWRSDGGERLILQAGDGRYDLWRGFQQGFFASPSVTGNKKLSRIMDKLMVKEYTNYSGMILSQPGSANQYYHRDTDTLASQGTDGSQLMCVDDFYFTTLIPITVGMTKQNGCTGFMVGSHRTTASKFDELEVAAAECPVGSALLFNGKINHRGRANESDQDRPAIYTVYHKRWYNDNFRMGIDEEPVSRL